MINILKHGKRTWPLSSHLDLTFGRNSATLPLSDTSFFFNSLTFFVLDIIHHKFKSRALGWIQGTVRGLNLQVAYYLHKPIRKRNSWHFTTVIRRGLWYKHVGCQWSEKWCREDTTGCHGNEWRCTWCDSANWRETSNARNKTDEVRRKGREITRTAHQGGRGRRGERVRVAVKSPVPSGFTVFVRSGL